MRPSNRTTKLAPNKIAALSNGGGFVVLTGRLPEVASFSHLWCNLHPARPVPGGALGREIKQFKSWRRKTQNNRHDGIACFRALIWLKFFAGFSLFESQTLSRELQLIRPPLLIADEVID
jgi:hypothetical protein